MKWTGFIGLFSGVLLSLVSLAAMDSAPRRAHLHSAIRYHNESAKHALARYLRRLGPVGAQQIKFRGTVLSAARPLDQLNFSDVPRWPSKAEALAGFLRVRDTRFIRSPDRPDFLRRSTWFYPDDGCFARAGLMVQNLENWGHVRPGKAFIFGTLRVRTANSPSGEVGWWYHVVPVLMLDDQPIVFDPAIDPKNPLLLLDWVKTMTDDPRSVTMSLCNPDSYVPNSQCSTPAPDTGRRAMVDQLEYLPSEWERLVALRRNPEEELGDNPKWPAGTR